MDSNANNNHVKGIHLTALRSIRLPNPLSGWELQGTGKSGNLYANIRSLHTILYSKWMWVDRWGLVASTQGHYIRKVLESLSFEGKEMNVSR